VPFKYFVELLLLSAIWGASFLFMRTTSADFGPIMLITLRTGIAAVVLIPFLLYKKQTQIIFRYWLPILLVAVTNTAIPFCLFAYSTLYLGAGFASVLNATAPMFAALVGFYWLKDKLNLLAVVGLFIGFIGVLLLSLARENANFATSVLPILAALCATLLYGVAACLTKRYLQGVNSLAIATGSQCFAVLLLAPLSLFYWPASMPSIQSWWQVLALGVVCTAIAYILYFRLIANVGAAKAITVAYLVPVFGIVWGMAFLNEHLTPGMWLGAALVLVGVALTTNLFKRRVTI
jgi:drug/metabolite transporter (DMT)-like permease